MEKRLPVDLQAISVEFQSARPSENASENLGNLAMLYMRALEELGYRRRKPRKPKRAPNAVRRKSVGGVNYGARKI